MFDTIKTEELLHILESKTTQTTNEEVIRLISEGADVFSKNRDGSTSFHLCAQNGNAELMAILYDGIIDTGRDPMTLKDNLGQTPLHYAALNDDPSMISTLTTEYEANPNAQDKNAKTAAHIAATSGKEKNLEELEKVGANFDIADNFGNKVQAPSALSQEPPAEIKKIETNNFVRGLISRLSSVKKHIPSKFASRSNNTSEERSR